MASFSFKSRQQTGETSDGSSSSRLDAQLKKMTQVCSRILVEIADYEEQIVSESQQVKALQDDPEADEYDVEKAKEILAETQNIIPIMNANLRKWCAKLEALLQTADQLEGLSDADESDRNKAREVWQKCVTRL